MEDGPVGLIEIIMIFYLSIEKGGYIDAISP
jgi:hypothetical protein